MCVPAHVTAAMGNGRIGSQTQTSLWGSPRCLLFSFSQNRPQRLLGRHEALTLLFLRGAVIWLMPQTHGLGTLLGLPPFRPIPCTLLQGLRGGPFTEAGSRAAALLVGRASACW